MNAQTIIKRQNSDLEVIIETRKNINSNYIRRIIILHDDEQTYDYIHIYNYKNPSPHNNQVSRNKWNYYNNLLNENLTLLQEEFVDRIFKTPMRNHGFFDDSQSS